MIPRVLLGIVAMLAACTVSRQAPLPVESQVWLCENDDDCIEGYGCHDLAPYGDAYCAPYADAGCEGVETAGGFCVDTCQVGEDGCEEGFECVRGFLYDQTGVPPGLEDRVDSGYCLPVVICDEDSDCEGDDICLSSVYEGEGAKEAGIALDALVCVSPCEVSTDCESDEVCPFAEDDGGGDNLGMCAPRCSADEPCPPLYACLDIFEEFAGVGAFCVPSSFPLLPCADETNCLLGECLEAFGDTFCSAEGCEGRCLDTPVFPEGGGGLPFLGSQCDTDEDVCGAVLGYFAPCTSTTIHCAEGFECHDFPKDGIPEVCALPCGVLWFCPEGLYCGAGLLWCLPKKENNEPCIVDAECLSGVCGPGPGRVCVPA